MIQNNHTPRMDCAVDATMSVIEGKWKTVILCKLAVKGPLRFNRLQKEIGAISARILTIQLKELENDGMINRIQYQDIPPKVEYSLTAKGESILPVLKAMAIWGLENMFPNMVEIETTTKGEVKIPSA